MGKIVFLKRQALKIIFVMAAMAIVASMTASVVYAQEAHIHDLPVNIASMSIDTIRINVVGLQNVVNPVASPFNSQQELIDALGLSVRIIDNYLSYEGYLEADVTRVMCYQWFLLERWVAVGVSDEYQELFEFYAGTSHWQMINLRNREPVNFGWFRWLEAENRAEGAIPRVILPHLQRVHDNGFEWSAERPMVRPTPQQAQLPIVEIPAPTTTAQPAPQPVPTTTAPPGRTTAPPPAPTPTTPSPDNNGSNQSTLSFGTIVIWVLAVIGGIAVVLLILVGLAVFNRTIGRRKKNHKIPERKKTIRELKSDNEMLESENQTLSKKVDKLTNDKKELNEKVDKLTNDKKELSKKVDKLTNDKKELNEKVDALTSDNQNQSAAQVVEESRRQITQPYEFQANNRTEKMTNAEVKPTLAPTGFASKLARDFNNAVSTQNYSAFEAEYDIKGCNSNRDTGGRLFNMAENQATSYFWFIFDSADRNKCYAVPSIRKMFNESNRSLDEGFNAQGLKVLFKPWDGANSTQIRLEKPAVFDLMDNHPNNYPASPGELKSAR